MSFYFTFLQFISFCLVLFIFFCSFNFCVNFNAHLLVDICIQGVSNNDPTCFCQNFVKFPPNLIIFGTQIAKTTKLCEVHSLSYRRQISQEFLDTWRPRQG